MRRSSIVLGIAVVSGLALGAAVGTFAIKSSKAKLLSNIVGIWQFPEAAVWIRVLPDGTFLQCRSTHGMFVALGKATLHDDGTIDWDIPVWGSQTASTSDGKLVLSRPGKKDVYISPMRQPGPECLSKLGSN